MLRKFVCTPEKMQRITTKARRKSIFSMSENSVYCVARQKGKRLSQTIIRFSTAYTKQLTFNRAHNMCITIAEFGNVPFAVVCIQHYTRHV